jgi:two-component system sensor histidine kinase GlrK
MVSNTQKLDALIAELINYSQVNAQIGERRLESVNMRDLVLSLIEDYQIRLRAKSLVVQDSIGPVEMLGNPEQLRTIVDNLLSNAVKYSPVGGEVRIVLRKVGGHMELEIEDNGPGIDRDERLHVFEPFFQGRAARAAGVKGTGFGLAIVSECVASHHGKVEVMEPRRGKAGARISVKIPLKSDK